MRRFFPVRFGLLLTLVLTCASAARAATDDADALVVVTLEDHWVTEVAGMQFGLVRFDTPRTTVLAGPWEFDLPGTPAAAGVVAAGALAAVAVMLLAHRRPRGV